MTQLLKFEYLLFLIKELKYFNDYIFESLIDRIIVLRKQLHQLIK